MMFLDKPHPQMLHMVYAMCMHAQGLSGPQSAAIHREAQPKIYDVHGAELQGLHMKVFQADQWASAGSTACCTSDILQIEALVLSALSKPVCANLCDTEFFSTTNGCTSALLVFAFQLLPIWTSIRIQTIMLTVERPNYPVIDAIQGVVLI